MALPRSGVGVNTAYWGFLEKGPHLISSRIFTYYISNTAYWALLDMARYMYAPLHSDLKLAFGVLIYLKNASGKGISFNKGDKLNLSVYVDSDWAKCKVTRKSVTAKYRAMNSVTCKVFWILKILAKLNIDASLPVQLHCDNSSAIQIAANPVFYERTNHFEIELFFLREKVADGVVKTVKVKSADNIADIFTKGLSVQDHNKFCDNLEMYDLYRIGLRGNIKNTKSTSVLGTNKEIHSKVQELELEAAGLETYGLKSKKSEL
ncbi:hypothetical protein Tco_0738798 [Tanacetum coccineum]